MLTWHDDIHRCAIKLRNLHAANHDVHRANSKSLCGYMSLSQWKTEASWNRAGTSLSSQCGSGSSWFLYGSGKVPIEIRLVRLSPSAGTSCPSHPSSSRVLSCDLTPFPLAWNSHPIGKRPQREWWLSCIDSPLSAWRKRLLLRERFGWWSSIVLLPLRSKHQYRGFALDIELKCRDWVGMRDKPP